jgi:GNAT superfamily N-acetyltransferase
MNEVQIYIRVATGHDREKLRGMFARSSPQTIYKRFHIPYPEVPERMLSLMVGIDHLDKEVLVAVAQEKVIGHATYVRLGDDSEAEMAIAVEDRWQSMGVGKSLLLELAQRARLRDIETFTAEVFGQNRPMLDLAAMFPGTDYSTRDGVYHVRMSLRTPVPAAVPHAHAVRSAA